jgi:KEOPS complex subunit Cgi121
MRVVDGIATVEDVEAFVDRLDAIGDEHGVAVQAIDARYVAGRRHLERAVELATRERGRGAAIARDPGVELLLYAAGRRQIDRALEMGVDEGESPVVVVVADVDGGAAGKDDEADGNGDEDAAADAVAALDPFDSGVDTDAGDRERIREFFDIGERELAATDATLEELVCERVALLVVER